MWSVSGFIVCHLMACSMHSHQVLIRVLVICILLWLNLNMQIRLADLVDLKNGTSTVSKLLILENPNIAAPVLVLLAFSYLLVRYYWCAPHIEPWQILQQIVQPPPHHGWKSNIFVPLLTSDIISACCGKSSSTVSWLHSHSGYMAAAYRNWCITVLSLLF